MLETIALELNPPDETIVPVMLPESVPISANKLLAAIWTTPAFKTTPEAERVALPNFVNVPEPEIVAAEEDKLTSSTEKQVVESYTYNSIWKNI